MLMPVGTAGRDRYKPYATYALIFINAAVFLWEMLYLRANGEIAFINILMNITFNVCDIGIQGLPIMVRNGLFSMFLHGSLAHVAGNMMFLWVFGRKVEEYFGRVGYVIVYILAGYVAIIGHAWLGGVLCLTDTDGLLVGASGAVAGMMGCLLFLHPSLKIKTIVVAWQVKVPAFFFLLFWFISDFLQGVGWFAADGDPVAHWAHIAGFIFGFGLVFITTMFWKPAPKVDPFAYLDE
jgi:membrane associated rhomboid family serine protease